ncbi:uncharacterized protein LOC134185556 [Corticium candelabrum]|uniref:uncharacterized protein LOC134185556 n=1 Tax=Corticium candelabrum TaxID=121492 RepID=UPI002E269BF7|nr:uncharacterized protein LOC134185556 [Corticium candelabrum]
MSRLLVCFASLLSLVDWSLAYPIHAECKLTWTFPKTSCANVSTALIKQMKMWHTDKGCENGGEEKCLYTFKSFQGNVMKATHETPVHHYADDQTYTFTNESSGGCDVQGFSTSEVWYAYLDYSTNYCNMHNLLTGSGLDKMPGFQEKSSTSVCTQYDKPNCAKY